MPSTCDASGPRGNTPAGRPCTHTYSCSQQRARDRVRGWHNIPASCLEPPPGSTPVRTLMTRYGKPCTHSSTVSRRKIQNKERGWNFILPECAGDKKKSATKKSTTSTKKSAKKKSATKKKSAKKTSATKTGVKKEAVATTTGSDKKRKSVKSTVPKENANDLRVGTKRVGQDGRMYKVYKRQSTVRRDGTRTTYKMWKLA